MAITEHRYISLKDAAVYLSLSPKTLYEWVEKRSIPAYKLGRVWRFDLKELDGFVRSSVTSSNAVCYNFAQSSVSATVVGRKMEAL